MSTMQEDTVQAKDQIDEFATLLLDTLYALSPYARNGLMPVSLLEKSASYEKYPQELFTLLEVARSGAMAQEKGLTQSAIENAFATWRSRLLRKLDYLDVNGDVYYRHLERLHAWMRRNAALFDHTTVRHLRNSMFGRTYAYLYPRLSLIMEFANEGAAHGLLEQTVEGGKRLRAVADPAFIAEHFAACTKTTQERIKDNLNAEKVSEYLRDAQVFLLAQQAYFDRVFRNKAPKKEDDR